MTVVWHRERRTGAVRLAPHQREVFPLRNQLASQARQRGQSFSFRCINRELRHDRSKHGFRHKRLECRAFRLQRFAAKGLDMEPEGALHVPQPSPTTTS